MRHIRRPLTFAGCMALGAGILAAQPPWWMDNVVKIEARGKSGAGVVLTAAGNEIFILTAWHVIDGASSATVTFHNAPLSPHTVALDPQRLHVRKDYDIAAFPAPSPDGSGAPFRPLVTRPLQNDDRSRTVSLTGFPGADQDWKPVINVNTITSISDPAKPYCFSFTKISLGGGFSGSPVVDQGDNFLGLMIETGAEAYAVKAGEILDAFATMNPNLILRPNETPPTPSMEPAHRAIIAGLDFHCVLVDGDMYCWGNNMGRWIGGNPYRSNTPWKISLPRKAHAASTTLAHICALLVNGDVLCWGYNDDGRVDGEKSEPVALPRRVSLPEPAVGVSAGRFHTCALGKSGKIYCWGSNGSGNIGAGSTDDAIHKPQLVQLPGPATQVAAGGTQSCALSNRQIYCWGETPEGKFPSPKQLASGFEFRSISAGYKSVCGITTDSATLCLAGGSGDSGPASAFREIRVSDYPEGVAVCGWGEAGTVECWDPTRGTKAKLGKYADIAPKYITCAINEDADVDCWAAYTLLFRGESTAPGRLEEEPWKAAKVPAGR